MKYCSHCGKEILDEAVVCTGCGCSVSKGTSNTDLDIPNTGLNVVSFLLPIVGLILYIIFHEKAPSKASAIGKWALIGLIVGVVLQGIGLGLMLV